MDISRLSERLMGMDDATWERHANPWSGWTRITVLPLFCIAIWSRVWLGWGAMWPVLAVVVWTWANPRLFGPPPHYNAWMTRAVLGERLWLTRSTHKIPTHQMRVAPFLTYAAGVGALVLAYGLWALDLGWVIAGLTLAMGAKLWFLDRMVWLFEENRSFCPTIEKMSASYDIEKPDIQ